MAIIIKKAPESVLTIDELLRQECSLIHYGPHVAIARNTSEEGSDHKELTISVLSSGTQVSVLFARVWNSASSNPAAKKELLGQISRFEGEVHISRSDVSNDSTFAETVGMVSTAKFTTTPYHDLGSIHRQLIVDGDLVVLCDDHSQALKGSLTGTIVAHLKGNADMIGRRVRMPLIGSTRVPFCGVVTLRSPNANN